MTRGTAPPTPCHSPARPRCRQMVPKASSTFCRERAQGHRAAPARPGAHPAHPAGEAPGSDGPHLVRVLVSHSHRGHCLGLQLRFDL